MNLDLNFYNLMQLIDGVSFCLNERTLASHPVLKESESIEIN